MCHVKSDIEIVDSRKASPQLRFRVRTVWLDMCADDKSGVLRRVLRLLSEHFCDRFGVLSVEGPVGRCCGSIPGHVRIWEGRLDEVPSDTISAKEAQELMRLELGRESNVRL